MRNALAPVNLVKALLNRSKKLNPVSDLVHGGTIGKLTDRIEDKLFLSHAANMGLPHSLCKREKRA